MAYPMEESGQETAMEQPTPIVMTVSRDEAERRFEELLRQVTNDKIQITIEEDGEPVAVVTPIDEHRRRQARHRFLSKVEEIQKRMNLTAEEADELAREAVQAVRRQRRA